MGCYEVFNSRIHSQRGNLVKLAYYLYKLYGNSSGNAGQVIFPILLQSSSFCNLFFKESKPVIKRSVEM